MRERQSWGGEFLATVWLKFQWQSWNVNHPPHFVLSHRNQLKNRGSVAWSQRNLRKKFDQQNRNEWPTHPLKLHLVFIVHSKGSFTCALCITHESASCYFTFYKDHQKKSTVLALTKPTHLYILKRHLLLLYRGHLQRPNIDSQMTGIFRKDKVSHWDGGEVEDQFGWFLITFRPGSRCSQVSGWTAIWGSRATDYIPIEVPCQKQLILRSVKTYIKHILLFVSLTLTR